jgi:NAD(P)-dependent dehydrogenase (short-subunit alcohol dehydrogenase family)
VTGAGNGIGRAITEYLSSRGHRVFACARKQEDLASLGKLSKVVPFRLDVTNQVEIQDLVRRLRSEKESVYGLINNAGVAGFGPLVDLNVEELIRVYDVNLYGTHRMVRAILPFLMESKGRIVNMSSASGINTPKFLGAYSLSKHSVEAYSDTLREELSQFGIKVSLIEPGNFRSEMTANMFQFLKREELLANSPYRKELVEVIHRVFDNPERLHRTIFPPPYEVAEAVFDALFSETPMERYFVGTKDDVQLASKKILETLTQVNRGRQFGLSKEELAKLLDELFDQTSDS